MRFRRRRQPRPPEGVRFVMPDGTEVPVKCLYLGQDANGEHLWTPAEDPPGPVRAIRIAKLHPRTAFSFGNEWDVQDL